MNYDSIYDLLMSRAKMRKIYYPLQCYTEDHHILPACLFPEFKNLRKHPENCAILTPEEHYVAHQLLIKMARYKSYAGFYKLVLGAQMMTVGNKVIKGAIRSNKLFGWIKRKIHEETVGKPGHPHTQKTKDYLSAINTGKEPSQITRDKIAAAFKDKTIDEILGKEKAASKRLKEAETRKRTHYTSDKKYYLWVNIRTGIIEYRRKYELVEKYPELILNPLSSLTRNKRSQYKGWHWCESTFIKKPKQVPKPRTYSVDARKQMSLDSEKENNPNADLYEYTWHHPTNKTITCTRYDLVRAYPDLILNALSPLIRAKRKNYKGWSVELTVEVTRLSDARANKNKERHVKT